MKAIVVKDKFQKKLAGALRLVPSRPQLPILAKVLIKIDKDNTLTIRSTDLEMGGEFVTGCKADSAGLVVVDGRLVNEVIRGMTGDKVELEVKDGKLNLVSDGQRVSVTIERAKDFPPFPQVKYESVETKVESELFKQIAERVLFSVSRDEIRPVLSGVKITSIKDEVVEVATTDGVRLSVYKTNWPNLKDEVVVPARFIREVTQIEGESVGVGVLADNKQIFARSLTDGKDGQVIISQLIEGEFPKYQAIIPRDPGVKITLNRQLFKQRLSLVMIMAKDSGGAVKVLSGDKGQVRLVSESSVFGRAEAKLEADIEGEQVEIALNGRFLLEALEAIRDEHVIVGVSQKLKPVLIRGVEDEDYLHVLMPINLQE